MRSAKLCLRLCFPWALQEKMSLKKLRPKDGLIPRSISYSTRRLSRSIGNASSCIATFGIGRGPRKTGWTNRSPHLEDVRADYQESPVDTTSEVRKLVAACLWDVFSNENDVVDRDGRLVDIGSWRGAAGFLADQLNRESGVRQYDYMDFYMGSFWISERADLTPVYEMIFRRLKDHLLDWWYRFPQLHLIEFPADRPDRRRSYELEKMRADLEQANRKALDDLKLEPVPAIVLAYSNIYGVSPHGWPPWDFIESHD